MRLICCLFEPINLPRNHVALIIESMLLIARVTVKKGHWVDDLWVEPLNSGCFCMLRTRHVNTKISLLWYLSTFMVLARAVIAWGEATEESNLTRFEWKTSSISNQQEITVLIKTSCTTEALIIVYATQCTPLFWREINFSAVHRAKCKCI